MPLHGDDMFTEYPVRYIGYSSGLAQAVCGPTIANMACKSLKMVTVGFIFGHTLYKPTIIMTKQKNASANTLAVATGDTFIYEVLASGIFPPVFAKFIRSQCAKAFRNSWLKAGGASFVSVVCLLAAAHPMDKLIDHTMDVTVRKLY